MYQVKCNATAGELSRLAKLYKEFIQLYLCHITSFLTTSLKEIEQYSVMYVNCDKSLYKRCMDVLK